MRGKEKGVWKRLDFASQSYRGIMFVSYVLVGGLALILMVAGVFSWFNVYFKEQVSAIGIEQLKQIDAVYNSKIDLYHTQLKNAYHEPAIKNYIYSDTSDFQRDYELSRYLQNMIVYNEVIEYVGFYKNDTFHVQVGTKYPDMQEQEEVNKRLSESKDDMEHFVLQSPSGERKLCIFLTERGMLYGKPERGIVFMVNLRKLQNELFSSDVSGSRIIIFSNSGTPLLENDNFTEKEETELWKSIENQQGLKKDNKITIDGNSYIYNSMPSKQRGEFLVLLQDFHVQEAQMSEASRMMYMIFMGVLIAVLGFSVAMARCVYFPFKKFMEVLKDKAEFTDSSEAYSRERTQITSDKILYQVGMMSAGYYSDRVLSYLNSPDEKDGIPDILKLKDRNEHCLLILFWQEYVDSSRTGILSMEICHLLENAVQGCKVSVIVDKSEDSFLILLKEPRWINRISDHAFIVQILKEICDKEENGNRIFCAVSSLVQEEEDLPGAYKKIYMLRKSNLLGQSDTVMSEDDMNCRDDNVIPVKFYQDTLRAIREGEEESAVIEIRKLLMSISPYSFARQLHFLAELAVQISQLSYEVPLNNREWQEKYLDHYMKIAALQDQNQLKRFFEQLITNSCLENKVVKEKNLRIQVVDSLDYIQQNYKNPDICVDKVAEKFHISVSYYSKLFNEFVGMTFPEYINDLRLSFAKELLTANSIISIKRVAEISGFSNLSYFSAQFKKKYGFTPSGYRKIL